MSITRERADLCPGVLRPWPADDGALVRLRPAGGRLPSRALVDLVAVAEEHGDGRVHLTARANLQLRALPYDAEGRVRDDVVTAIEATGLLPSRSHELVRNLMASPQTGLAGGRADLRPLVAELDERLCADERLASLPGRFLFVLDDRGDLLDRTLDLGLVAVNGACGQLRIGSAGWGAMVPLTRAAAALVALAHRFLDARGDGPSAVWHVDELGAPLERPCARYVATEPVVAPLPAGAVPGGTHHVVADGTVDRALAERLAAASDVVVVDAVARPAGAERDASMRELTPPPSRYDYVKDGPAIYVDSFATIRREARLDGVPTDAEKLAVRMIHGSGQVDLVDDLVVHPQAVASARLALATGATVLCDARMVAVGITAGRLPADNPVECFLRDERVPGLAAAWGTTRTAAAVSLWEPHLEGSVVAIGNAPTALFHLLEMLVAGAPRPAVIIGCPVGFIGAAESKDALASFADDHGIDVPFVTVRGRRGGSAITSSAVNALATEVE